MQGSFFELRHAVPLCFTGDDNTYDSVRRLCSLEARLWSLEARLGSMVHRLWLTVHRLHSIAACLLSTAARSATRTHISLQLGACAARLVACAA